MKDRQNPPEMLFSDCVAYIGIDWGDKEHVVHVIDQNGGVDHATIAHTPEEIAAWAEGIRKRYDGRPVAVAIEQSKGPMFYALVEFDHLRLYPINPCQSANYRKVLKSSGAKSDELDAKSLAMLIRDLGNHFRPWKPDDAATQKLGALCEFRRKTVDSRAKTVLQLQAILKTYFPQAPTICGPLDTDYALTLLSKWPSLKAMQRANPNLLRDFLKKTGRTSKATLDKLINDIRAMRPLTTNASIIDPCVMYVQDLVERIKLFNKKIGEYERELNKTFASHQDASLFKSLPGAGKALAPRLAVAFGTDRDRFQDASELQALSGIAPVTEQSGQSRWVHRRWTCRKFLLQTFHEFADHARKWSTWSKAYYRSLREKGTKHNAAVRKLAFKWIRIIFRMWKTHEPYDEARYITQLKKRRSPIADLLKTA